MNPIAASYLAQFDALMKLIDGEVNLNRKETEEMLSIMKEAVADRLRDLEHEATK